MFKIPAYATKRNLILGEMSYHANRWNWTIPTFHTYDAHSNIHAIHSERFLIGNKYWYMHVRACGSKKIQSNYSQLEVGISTYVFRNLFLAKSFESPFDEGETTQDTLSIVKIGITGTNIELFRFGTLRHSDLQISFELLDRSEVQRKQDQWLPGGNLHLFLSVEDLSESSATEKSSQKALKRGIRKLQEDLRDILSNGNISDVVLKVDDQEFNAHRCILAARSPVFSAMLKHDTREKNTGVVTIEDVEPDTFYNFLKYLYAGSDEDITSQNAQKLYVAADKYQVEELKKTCMNHMLKNISVDNFCDLLTLSLLHEEKDLTDACSGFFVKNSLAIVKTLNWRIFLTENPIEGNDLYLKTLEINNKK